MCDLYCSAPTDDVKLCDDNDVSLIKCSGCVYILYDNLEMNKL